MKSEKKTVKFDLLAKSALQTHSDNLFLYSQEYGVVGKCKEYCSFKSFALVFYYSN